MIPNGTGYHPPLPSIRYKVASLLSITPSVQVVTTIFITVIEGRCNSKMPMKSSIGVPVACPVQCSGV